MASDQDQRVHELTLVLSHTYLLQSDLEKSAGKKANTSLIYFLFISKVTRTSTIKRNKSLKYIFDMF